MNLPPIENALDNIKYACHAKMNALYPQGIPDDIYTRYEQELAFLASSNLIDDFEIFRLLSTEAKKGSNIITTRGTIAGSFLFYLLGNNCFNPLPVYYYCEKCGYYEKVNTHLFGMDLPQKECPYCKESITADGFNLAIESVWGLDGQKLITFEYNVNSEFLPFAKKILEKIYPENSVVPWGMFKIESGSQIPYPDDRAIGVNLSGYIILPNETIIDDYPDYVSYLENGDPCIAGGGWTLKQSLLKPIHLFPLDSLDMLIKLQRLTGIYVNEITTKELRGITWSNLFNLGLLNSTTSNFIHELRPHTFKSIVSLEASSHNTFSWQDKDKKWFSDFQEMINDENFIKYPCYTREDFFDYLIEAGIDTDIAFQTSERVRKGHANPKHDPNKNDFFDLPIPNEIKEVAKNYLYLFPRAHCTEQVLIYARLAYYARIDSRAFSKVKFKK